MNKIIIALILLGSVGTALCAQDSKATLQRALELRNQSGPLFRDKRYAEAAKVLKEADELYAGLQGDHRDDRAVVLRARSFNECHAGNLDGALESLSFLASICGKDPNRRRELNNAYASAFYSILVVQRPKAERMELVRRCRKVFKKHGQKSAVAFTWHHEGGLFGDAGHRAGMIRAYDRAARLRRDLGETQALAWSRNNQAFHLLQGEADSKAAWKALQDSFAIAHSGKARDHVRATGINLSKLLDLWKQNPVESKSHLAELQALALTTASSDAASLPTADLLLRAALRLDEAASGPKKALKFARRFMKLKSLSLPPEVKGELALLAAGVALRAKDPKLASRWLREADAGSGPCAAHLRARIDLERAAVAGQESRADAFFTIAEAACSAFAQLKDFAGEGDARRRVAELASEHFAEDSRTEALRAGDQRFRKRGQPGGAGGSASSSGGGKKYGPGDPVFRIGMVEGRLRITDLLSGRHQDCGAPRWSPRIVCVNGLKLRLFGGYVFVLNSIHGGPSQAEGAAPLLRLDPMGAHLALGEKHDLVILGCGAIRWERK